jgi:hypothetical protein
MRDRRFVAVHRGGPLDVAKHRLLAMADHCLGPAIYGCKAVEATGASADAERAWQLEQLPDAVQELIVSALGARRFRSLERGQRAE